MRGSWFTGCRPTPPPTRSAAPQTRSPGRRGDFAGLLDLIGDAHFVLLGEATHGTHEFYSARARITRRLIEERGFNVVAVEADWPDAYRIHRFVRGTGADSVGIEALGDFKRFPRWMWRNADVLEFIGWLREHNSRLPERDRVGFYGLDLYSLYGSMEAVVGYLEKVDPPAAERARRRYGCFGQYSQEPQQYGYVASLGLDSTCEGQVVEQLAELRRSAVDYLSRDGVVAEDELFAAEQNARLARNAERYYREMYRGEVSSWNLRDRHMADTLDALGSHLTRQRGVARVAVWEHNSHLGDARATSMGHHGEWNVGQLARETYGRDAVLVGFTTYDGTVSAASDWGGSVERKNVRPARPESYEALFHHAGRESFWLDLRRDAAASQALRDPRLERAIGVIYRPESELTSHYFHATLPEQFDAVIHFDRTRAVEPLDKTSGWETGEAPETYPTGFKEGDLGC